MSQRIGAGVVELHLRRLDTECYALFTSVNHPINLM